jgi:nucleoside-diphosphate-sugar epimerase
MILVTGGTGLVGSHLLVKLTEKETSIRAIYRNDKSIEKTKLVFKALNAEPNFEKIKWFKADLLDYFELENAFEGVSHIYHAAAKVSFAAKDEVDLMSTNIDGTINMVNLA